VKALSEATLHSLQDCLALLYTQRKSHHGNWTKSFYGCF
jgi:hypothetical protein